MNKKRIGLTAVLVIIIVLYVWSVSTPMAQAEEDMSPYPIETRDFSDETAPAPYYESIAYLSMFFIGGISITAIQGSKDKSNKDNDLVCMMKMRKR